MADARANFPLDGEPDMPIDDGRTRLLKIYLVGDASRPAEASETPATKSAEGEDNERDGFVLV